MVETEFALVRFQGDAARAAKVYEGMQPLTAADVADAILWCVTRPSHVTVNALEIMPTAQAFSAFAVHRRAAPRGVRAKPAGRKRRSGGRRTR